ncbi:MAG: hypothetical protein ABUT20_37055, partial [Bacteroidota bacterium]
PTGKRMHKPYFISIDQDEDMYDVLTPRDAASGQASGKRMHKPFVITKELDFTRNGDEVATYNIMDDRDAASGLATGKRMHKPYVISVDPDEGSYEVISPRDVATGQASGKRMHKPFVITKELDIAQDGNNIVTYNIIHRDLAARNVLSEDEDDNDGPQKMAITEQGLPKKPAHKKGIITGKDNDNGMYTDASEEDVVNNPLYQQSGSQGVNPLFEAKGDLMVTGSNGTEHHIFTPSNIIIKQGSQPAITPFNEYEVGPIKWMAPESLTKETAGKGITEKGIKKNEAAAKSINEKGIKRSTTESNAKNINTSEDNLGSGKANEAVTGNDMERKGWDGVVKGGAIVKETSRVHCADGTCSIDAIVVVDGKEYEALITGVLKTKHDTVKNSINNVR